MIVDLTMIQVPMMIVITDIHSHKYPLGVIIRLMDIFHYVTLIEHRRTGRKIIE